MCTISQLHHLSPPPSLTCFPFRQTSSPPLKIKNHLSSSLTDLLVGRCAELTIGPGPIVDLLCVLQFRISQQRCLFYLCIVQALNELLLVGSMLWRMNSLMWTSSRRSNTFSESIQRLIEL